MKPKNTQNKERGLLAIFDNPASIVSAARRVRQEGIKKVEAFTPFPVHGIENALGLKRSWIPWATLILALTGWCLGFIFQAWTSAIDWPLNVGGKPLISWPAFIPITFESMILIGGVSTTFILFAVCRLPNFKKPVLDERFTNDHFGLYIDKNDPQYNESRLSEILKEYHVKEIKNVS